MRRLRTARLALESAGCLTARTAFVAIAESTFSLALRPRTARFAERLARARRVVDAIAEVVVARTAAEGLLALEGGFAATRRRLRAHRTGEGFSAFALVAAAGLSTAATARLVFAHVIETAQFARFVVDMAVDVRGLVAILADADFHRARLALADHRLQGQHRRMILQTEALAQGFDLLGVHFYAMAALEQAGQGDVAVTHALQAADLVALRFPQTTDFAIAAFRQHDLKPGVRIAGTDAFDLVELRRTVVQRDAAREPVDDVVRYFAMDAADILALDLAGRMHQRIGQFAVGGQQQQAGGVDVQATDGDPARALQARQRFEDGRAALGVFARGDFAFGLVVDQHARRFGQRAGDEGLAVDLDAIAARHRLAGACDLAVDLDQAVGDALFKRAARTEAGLGEHLVQTLLDLAGGVFALALQRKGLLGLAVTHLSAPARRVRRPLRRKWGQSQFPDPRR